jgi:hypothetical protein
LKSQKIPNKARIRKWWSSPRRRRKRSKILRNKVSRVRIREPLTKMKEVSTNTRLNNSRQCRKKEAR